MNVSLDDSIRVQCQRAGTCCWQATSIPGKRYSVDGIDWERQADGGVRCPKLSREDHTTCTIYQTPDYPLACRMYPLGLFDGQWRFHSDGPCQGCLVGPERTVRAYLTDQGVL